MISATDTVCVLPSPASSAQAFRVSVHQRSDASVRPCPPCPVLPPHLTANRTDRALIARVQRAGKMHQRYFPLSRYGGWESAIDAAQVWLRALLAQLPLIAAQRERLTVRNRSGVAGVHFRSGKRLLKNGLMGEYPGYVARWPGAKAGVRWMFSTHGREENAFLLACLCRRLETPSRILVGAALRALTPAQRADLLARRRPILAPIHAAGHNG